MAVSYNFNYAVIVQLILLWLLLLFNTISLKFILFENERFNSIVVLWLQFVVMYNKYLVWCLCNWYLLRGCCVMMCSVSVVCMSFPHHYQLILCQIWWDTTLYYIDNIKLWVLERIRLWIPLCYAWVTNVPPSQCVLIKFFFFNLISTKMAASIILL